MYIVRYLIVALIVLAGSAFADPITDFAVYGDGNVNVTIGATVTGAVGSDGALAINGLGTTTGDAKAAVSINVGLGGTVDGNALSPSITDLLGTITGTKTIGPFMGATVPTTTFSASGVNLINPASIAPGMHGFLIISSAANAVVLTAGDYYFDFLTITLGDVTFDTTGGAINIFVDGNLTLGAGFAASLIGSTSLLTTEVDGVSNILGTYYGTLIGSGGINIPGTLNGRAWSESTVTVNGGTVTGLSAAIPEPAALAFIAAAGCLFVVYRRRRRAG